MKRRITILALILIATAFVAVPLLEARPHGRGMHGGLLGKLRHAKEELGLSSQQVAEIKAIFRELREQNGDYREVVRGGLRDVAETLLKNPNDLAAAQARLDAQAAAERALRHNLLNATSKALNVLTPEQRKKLEDLRMHGARQRDTRRRGSTR